MLIMLETTGIGKDNSTPTLDYTTGVECCVGWDDEYNG